MFSESNIIKKIISIAAVLILSAVLTACSDSSGPDSDTGNDEVINLDYSTHKLQEKLVWLTNNTEKIIASSDAKKGGTINLFISTFPLTFRTIGPDANSATRSYFLDNQLSLVTIHPETEKIIPELATHWAYGKDGRTMYFKINPDARWSDGMPVTADDFIFTLEFMRSKHIQDPWYNDYYTQEIEKVTKYGDYLVSVTAVRKVPDLWNTVGLRPTPKHFYVKINKDYVSKYNWAIEPNTGPYILKDFSKGKYLLFERKKDWWAKDLRYFKNRFNVDYFKLIVIRDDNVAFEYFKKGEIDTYAATRAAIWYDKGQGDLFSKGYVEKLWFYNNTRRPIVGFYLNLEKEIFKDKNLRYAFAHSINWDRVNKQVLHGEAVRLHTFFTGYGEYTNNSLRAREYSIQKVDAYMKASGWTRGTDGIWMKDGKRFAVTISYGQEAYTPRLVILKEEARKAGVDINLELLDQSNSYKKVMEKKHEVAYMAWGTGFRPQPWEMFHSVNAHKTQTNNINNIDDPVMDKLIDRYRTSTNERELINLSRQIQQRLYEIGCWIGLETTSFIRYFHWRWIRFPEIPGYRHTESIFGDPQSSGYFWIDEEMKKETLEAMKSGRAYQPVTRIIKKYQ